MITAITTKITAKANKSAARPPDKNPVVLIRMCESVDSKRCMTCLAQFASIQL